MSTATTTMFNPKNSTSGPSSEGSPRTPPLLETRSPFGLAVSIFFGSLLILGLLASVIGNTLTCYVINKSRRLQSTTNYFIVALASCGLVVSSTMPFIIYVVIVGSWVFPEAVCRLVAFVVQACLGANIFILVSICLDRFYTIIYPLSFKITRGRAKKMILLSWSVAIGFALPSAYFYTKSQTPVGHLWRCQIGPGEHHWQLAAAYLVPLTCAEYIVPFVIIGVDYYRVGKFIWIFNSNAPRFLQRTVNHVPRSKITILKIILLTNLVDFVAASAFHALRFAQISPATWPVDIFSLFVVIFFFDTLAKPTIYLILNSNFRRGCREVLCWSKLHCYRQELYAVTTVSALAKKNYVSSAPYPSIGGHPDGKMAPVTTVDGLKLPNIDGEPRMKPRGFGPEGHQAWSPVQGTDESNSSSQQSIRRQSATFDRSTLISRDAWPLNKHSTTFI